MKTSNTFYSLIVVVAIALLTSCATEPDKASKSPKGKRVALFDGKTLDGWKILKCEAAVDNGHILIKTGNGLIQTEKMYGDFILEFEWKALRESISATFPYRRDAPGQGVTRSTCDRAWRVTWAPWKKPEVPDL